ncbi:hypothetical protein FRC09_006614 [Ceratobasidium sp. 395]|nr:hypothetical protein FRC09_006614 [Ceratobasidium sp. 395]
MDYMIETNKRPHFVESYNPLPQPHAADRTGLYYAHCQTYLRPKFICAKPTCRRSIKPSYDPDRNDYRIDEFQNWSVRPLPSRIPEMATAFRAETRLYGKSNPHGWAFRELRARYFEDPGSISAEEFSTLKAQDPGLWWIELVRNGEPDAQVPASHNIRCPSCGDHAVRVGSTFRIPPQKDDKSWRKIERMIESGEDMAAKFSSCATVEMHKEMVEEAQRITGREKGAKSWNEEKWRRINALKLSGEETRAEPASPSGLTSESSWDVVD